MPVKPHNQSQRRGRRSAPGRSPQRARSDQRRAPERRPEKPLPPLNCSVELDSESIAHVAERMREGKRAHPFFETARKILSQPRHLLFLLKPQQGATVKFHTRSACGEPFLDAAAAIEHQLRRHSDALFSAAQAEIDPPKGNFVLMAACGFCREPLCPPNFHRYTELLINHHRRRHGRERFDEFKASVRMSREAEDVDAWKKSLSLRMEFQCKLCETKVVTRPDLSAHMLSAHGAQLQTETAELSLPGAKVFQLECGDLHRFIEAAMAQQRKPNGNVVARLRRALNAHGLQFFRTAAGHQFISSVQPRSPHERDCSDPLRLEILRLTSAPARRGHKPTRKILMEHFCPALAGGDSADPASAAANSAPDGTAGVVSETVLQTAIDDLIGRGFLVEYADGELDAPALAKEESAAPPALAGAE
jgi:hypothetical protein